MILVLFLISEKFLLAFNEDLRAVHYSMVTAGIDDELKPGKRTINILIFPVIDEMNYSK